MSSTTGTDRSTDVGFPNFNLVKLSLLVDLEVRATQNMPFEIITPNVQNLTVSGTSISAEVRTVQVRVSVEMKFHMLMLDLKILPSIKRIILILQE